jgi:enamine deaminase RidA (YjgF/YER057c/UK114 family)
VAVEYRDAPALAPPPGYSHVAVAPAGTLVLTAGAVPLDADGNVVGPDDPAAQARLVLDNLVVALQTGGASPSDVLKTTVYVVGGHDAQLAVWDVVRGSSVGRAPSTLLGVASLGYRGQVVEIEAVAVTW